MRVLDTYSGQFAEIDPKQEPRWSDPVKYAILSHTWDPEGEQTYQQLRDVQKRHPPPSCDLDDPLSYLPFLFKASLPIWDDPEVSSKIREACRVARENGCRYIWIDSCCIDKTSSSELSESINSMYQWYARARICYVFLPDVPAEADHQRRGSYFRGSRWFKRGWTLQELIAPRDVLFLSTEWTSIGSKEDLADLVVEVTNIHYNALLNLEPLDEFSVAQRFSWAVGRETTREEDRAYSLLGIFDINMPTLYGEGDRAFRRLQEEIMRRSPDQSLFAWSSLGLPDPASQLYEPDTTPSDGRYIRRSLVKSLVSAPLFLAPSLDYFRHSTDITAISHDEVARRLQLLPNELSTTDYAFTPHGIRTQLPVISFCDYLPPQWIDVKRRANITLSHWYLVILGCGHEDFPGHLLARICCIQSSGSSIEFLHSGRVEFDYYDLLPLSPAAIAHFLSSGGRVSIKTLYIPQPERDQGAPDPARSRRHKTIKLVLSGKTRNALSARGYTATLRIPGSDDAHPRTHSVTLSHATHTITIDYQHTLGEGDWDSQELTMEAHVKTSGLDRQDTPGDPRVLRADGLDSGARVSWNDHSPWSEALGFRDVVLDIPGGPTALMVRLGLTCARTNHYLLGIELKAETPVLS